MSRREIPPFRADHVGSLLRPPELARARAAFKAGQIDGDGLREVEDEAIRGAVALQRDAGLQTVTDGEFRRTSWHMDFIYSLGGVEQVDGESLHVQFRSAEGEYDFAPPAMRIVYPEPDAFWDDLTEAYANELRGVYELGCRYLQLDDTSLAYVNDPAQRAHIEQIGGDPDHLHEQYIANLNRALADKPDDLVVTTHLCRGNNQSMWAAEGGYDFVAEALFGDLAVDGYFLEFDDERSGGFEPLRFVPPGKLVVLGLVTSKSPRLEDRDLLKRRVEEASRYVDLDQLCLSPQCGFSSTEEGNKLSIDEERAKLELVVEVAGEIWGG